MLVAPHTTIPRQASPCHEIHPDGSPFLCAHWHTSYRNGLGILWLGLFKMIQMILMSFIKPGLVVECRWMDQKCGDHEGIVLCEAWGPCFFCVWIWAWTSYQESLLSLTTNDTTAPELFLLKSVTMQRDSTLACKFSFDVYSRISQAFCSFQPD